MNDKIKPNTDVNSNEKGSEIHVSTISRGYRVQFEDLVKSFYLNRGS